MSNEVPFLTLRACPHGGCRASLFQCAQMSESGVETFYNLCPHEVTLYTADGLTPRLVIQSMGKDLRLLSAPQLKVAHPLGEDAVVTRQRFTGLDTTTPGYALMMEHPDASFIVSMPCAEWLTSPAGAQTRGRRGIYVPATGPKYAVRGFKGELVGCRAFEQYAAPIGVAPLARAPSPEPRTTYVAFDIEKLGSRRTDSLVEIGVCIGPKHMAPGVRPEVRLLNWAVAPLPGDTQDEKCLKEFWAQPANKAHLAEIQRAQKSAVTVMTELRQVCREVAQSGASVEVLSDNPSFDIAHLDAFGERTGTWTGPLQELDVGSYHSISDPSERLAALGPGARDAFEAWLSRLAPDVRHSHVACKDAEYIYYQMLYCNEQIKLRYG
jgi:hypothetical protein